MSRNVDVERATTQGSSTLLRFSSASNHSRSMLKHRNTAYDWIYWEPQKTAAVQCAFRQGNPTPWTSDLVIAETKSTGENTAECQQQQQQQVNVTKKNCFIHLKFLFFFSLKWEPHLNRIYGDARWNLAAPHARIELDHDFHLRSVCKMEKNAGRDVDSTLMLASLRRHHGHELFVIYLSIAVNVGFPDHFIDLLVGQLLPEVRHYVP